MAPGDTRGVWAGTTVRASARVGTRAGGTGGPYAGGPPRATSCRRRSGRGGPGTDRLSPGGFPRQDRAIQLPLWIADEWQSRDDRASTQGPQAFRPKRWRKKTTTQCQNPDCRETAAGGGAVTSMVALARAASCPAKASKNLSAVAAAAASIRRPPICASFPPTCDLAE